jgi:hypothetical protein
MANTMKQNEKLYQHICLLLFLLQAKRVDMSIEILILMQCYLKRKHCLKSEVADRWQTFLILTITN